LILNDKENGIKVDARLRRDKGFPVGFQDVIEIVKTKETFRVLYDVKGRFVLKALDAKESGFKLLKVKTKAVGTNKIPYIVTHDGRTIRFPHPEINVEDTVKYDINNGKILEWIKNDTGNTGFVTGGNNIGRVGQVQHVERHIGGYDIVHIKDSNGKTFATRKDNVFIIGTGKKPLISLPKENGIALTIL
jgi:small subunit ribosomal protein S4e